MCRVVVGATGRVQSRLGLVVGRVGLRGAVWAWPVCSPSFLSDPGGTVMVVEHGDRLTRFGFEQLAASLTCGGRPIVVLDAGGTGSDLAGDVCGVLASLCARRSGRGSGSRRATQAVAVATGGQPV